MEATVSSRILRRAEKELAQTKVILRHLPPDFTREKLLTLIDPLPPNDYFAFVPGNLELGKFGCSRAYINFKNKEDIVPFRDAYDGRPLESEGGAIRGMGVASGGVQYRMIIELAPYQIIPRGRVKADHRCGTITDDPDYKEFLENYDREIDPLPSIDITYLHEVEKKKMESLQATPLTEYCRNKYTVPRGGRGQKNKVLYAAGSKKRRGGGSKAGRESSSSKSKSGKNRKEKDGGKSAVGEKKGGGKRTESGGGEPVRIIVMDKPGKVSGMNGSSEQGKKDKGQKGSKTDSTSTGEIGVETSRKSSKGSSQKQPDQPLFVPSKSSSRKSGTKDRKDDVIVNHKEDTGGGKKRGGRGRDGYYSSGGGGYSKYGRGYDRHDNHYEFKEEDDSYQGPDHRSSDVKGSKNRNRDGYGYEDTRQSGSGRYHGRGRNHDRYDNKGGGGWEKGHRSSNK